MRQDYAVRAMAQRAFQHQAGVKHRFPQRAGSDLIRMQHGAPFVQRNHIGFSYFAPASSAWQ